MVITSYQVVLILHLLVVCYQLPVVTTEKYPSSTVKHSYIHSYWKAISRRKRKVKIVTLSEYLRQIRGGVTSDTTIIGDRETENLTIGHPTTIKKSPAGIPLPSISKQMGIDIVFSDVDGTLVHYDDVPTSRISDDNPLLYLPASSTGMRGVISSKTLHLVADLRKKNIKFVLVSGMRTSTLIKRLPFLPRADAYASEAGGRIFYPKKLDDITNQGLCITPEYVDGMPDDYMEPFTLEEDAEWRRRMSQENAAGHDGYAEDPLQETGTSERTPIAVKDRDGALWKLAKSLMNKGFVLDTKGYSCCFRVNRKQQQDDISDEDFQTLSSYNVSDLGLGSSVNLGCVDFYPINSGKKNCCAYLAKKFAVEENLATRNLSPLENLQRAVCLCDDDNDIEMALACRRAYLPSVTSSSIASIAAENPSKFTITETELVVGTSATEAALDQVIRFASGTEQIDLDQLKP